MLEFMLSFKKLDVYRCAIEFEALASEIDSFDPGEGWTKVEAR